MKGDPQRPGEPPGPRRPNRSFRELMGVLVLPRSRERAWRPDPDAAERVDRSLELHRTDDVVARLAITAFGSAQGAASEQQVRIDESYRVRGLIEAMTGEEPVELFVGA